MDIELNALTFLRIIYMWQLLLILSVHTTNKNTWVLLQHVSIF
jgi:hypothetical protein